MGVAEEEFTQERAPLFEGLSAYASAGMTGFHTPAHAGGRPFEPISWCRLDLTEVPLRPGGPDVPSLVAAAEVLAAAYFGAERTFLLGNGASIGVMAMILGACPPGGGIAISRDCHISMVNACVIGDLRPSFVEQVTVSGWSFPLGAEPGRLRQALAAGIPVAVTNPTYQGVAWDLGGLAGTGGCLLVDEAHGAHLNALPEYRGAKDAGARAWTHGCHKTLGSLAQTGLLHLGPGGPVDGCAAWLERLSSTSPSYPLLASLDLARRWAALHAREAWEKAAERLAAMRRALTRAGWRVLGEDDLPPGARPDPAKLTVAVPGGGPAAARQLHARYGIQAEAAGLDWLTFIITPFHTDEETARLSRALMEMERPPARDGGLPPWPAGLPARALWPRQAALGPRRRVPLARAGGLVAAEPLSPYPPGIPLLWPGEVLAEEILEYLAAVLAAGGTVRGVDAAGTIAVTA